MKFALPVLLTLLALITCFIFFKGYVPFLPDSKATVANILEKKSSEELEAERQEGLRKEFTRQIEDLRLAGLTPNEKVARLGALFQGIYPAILFPAGRYDHKRIPFSDIEINYVIWDVDLHFSKPKTIEEFEKNEETRSKILGELAIYTAKILSVKTHIPNIGENILFEMAIYATIRYGTETPKVDKTVEGPQLFEPGTYLQPVPERYGYIFRQTDIKGLLSEGDVSMWQKHATSLPMTIGFPNTGPVEKSSPVAPKD